ncbi:MAG TPA: flavin reductase family protein [Gaiellaceae bacterium]|jgi:flavin reductase (DIM6/NTAB) family NADH-FMN oxidoreductase RutF
MRAFPTGVAVASVDAPGGRLALTVGSLASLSLEPPLVGIAIGREAAMHELLREAGSFGISLLAGEQDGLAQHFARGVPPIALWHDVAWRPGPATGSPLLDEAVGWLECDVRAEHPAGDHTLFLGEVLAAEQGRRGPGLVYVGSAFRPGP